MSSCSGAIVDSHIHSTCFLKLSVKAKGKALLPPLYCDNLICLTEQPNIWFVSAYGSDENDCHTESTPCKNLQTVLNRAEDGADIYVTSETLEVGEVVIGVSCTIGSINSANYLLKCSGLYICVL